MRYSDRIFGKWFIGTGQFTTQEELDLLYEDRRCTFRNEKDYCFAGIDVAKHPEQYGGYYN